MVNKSVVQRMRVRQFGAGVKHRRRPPPSSSPSHAGAGKEKRRGAENEFQGKKKVERANSPTNISHARKLVAGMDVEYVFDGERRAEEVSSVSVYDAFGLAC